MNHNKIYKSANWERLISAERQSRMDPQEFFKIAKPAKTEVWADIGCGPGYFTLPLAKQTASVLAIDLSKDMLQICQNRASQQTIKNIEFIESDSSSIELASNHIDKLLLVNVYHEFPENIFVLKELGRILKPKGTLFVIDWRHEEMDSGPPLDHRIPEENVIEDFDSGHFTFQNRYNLYQQNYVLEFANRDA